MTPHDLLAAAARCWEVAGHPQRAAERWSTAGAWHDAGRCWAKAGRPVDAADAYARAGDPLAEARQWLTSRWPERAPSAYRRVLKGDATAAAEVEALVGLGDLEGALRRTLAAPKGVERLEALRALARLAAERGRPDVASHIWARNSEGDADVHEEWERFALWNSSLRWERPEGRSPASAWPSVPLTDVALALIWEEEANHYWGGDRAVDWSADGTQFAAALSTQGLGWGHVVEDRIWLDRWALPEPTRCARFVPGRLAVLTGHRSGEVRFVHEDGSSEPVEPLRMKSHVWSISFSPREDRVAVSSYKDPGAVLKILAWAYGSPGIGIEDLGEPGGNCSPLCAWSHDGRRLAWSPGPADTNRLVVLASEGRQEVPDAHRLEIESLSFTPDGRLLISASRDQTVVVRDGHTGQPLAPPERFESAVWGASLHPQAALLAVGEGGRLHLFRLHVGDPPRLTRLSEHPMDEDIKSLAFSPDGRHLLVMTESNLRLFRVDLDP